MANESMFGVLGQATELAIQVTEATIQVTEVWTEVQNFAPNCLRFANPADPLEDPTCRWILSEEARGNRKGTKGKRKGG